MKNKKQSTPPARVWPLLAHGGWKTSGELGCGFALGGSGPSLHELHGLLESCKVLVTDVPGSGRTMYHRTTAPARLLDPDAVSMTFQELPCSLKRSLINKMIRLQRDWETGPGIAVWARAMTCLEEHLDSIDLNAIRPRPDDRFFFPCGWLAAYDTLLNPGIPRQKEYTFHVDFVEVIPSRFGNLSSSDACGYENEDHQCRIMSGIDASLRLRMMHVAEARLERKNFKILECPSRDAIIDETVKRLQAGAAEWKLLIPFTPITIRPQFQLLTD